METYKEGDLPRGLIEERDSWTYQGNLSRQGTGGLTKGTYHGVLQVGISFVAFLTAFFTVLFGLCLFYLVMRSSEASKNSTIYLDNS